MSKEVNIRSDWRDGDVERIVDLHRRGYEQEGGHHYGADFLDHVRHTVEDADIPSRRGSCVWFVEMYGETVGCAAVVDRGNEGQLRWVVLTPETRGLGLGGRLLDAAMKHAEAQDWASIYLETTDGLEASMALYRRLGFKVDIAEDRPLWHGGGRFIQMRKAL
jgi:ribosomal protein S18 acetylase RimI-like enzyme